MKQAIRKRAKDFAAIVALMVVAAIVGTVILTHQRFYAPSWVPLIGKDFVVYKAELATAQAVTPGQGQTVTVAGVKVGDVSRVDLVNGRAVVTMRMEPEYTPIYRNATILLRPKTGLKDMVLELSPGRRTAGELPEGGTIPISNTLPDVNLDEVLAAVDSDTRSYLQLLLGGAGGGLRGEGEHLSTALRQFEPLSRDVAKATKLLSRRRDNLQRVIHNFSLLAREVGTRDTQLAQLVESSNAVFRTLASQDAALRESVSLLPKTLSTTNSTLIEAGKLSADLGPTLEALRPGARALKPALQATRPFLRTTTPVITDQLSPLARASLPAIRALRPAAHSLAKAGPDLTRVLKVLNYTVNELAYNPPGTASEGYLFWLAWANHLGASVFATQDAHGPIRRGLLLFSCSTLGLLDQIAEVNPFLKTIVALTNPPRQSQVCPGQAGAGSGGGR